MVRVFIGYDSREAVAYAVLAHSICVRASVPVSITPLVLPQLRPLHQREWHPLQSTEFAFTRFLTPYLCGFEGWAIFMDCDMLLRTDIAALWSLRDERFAVQVVKHDHVPSETTKFLRQAQSRYEKKNWSSVMLFNNQRCRSLTPEYVSRASGLELHQFKWLADESHIGVLPHRWNHLVGYDPYDPDAAIVHFTAGGPYFSEYRDSEYAEEWFQARRQMLSVEERSPRALASASAALPVAGG